MAKRLVITEKPSVARDIAAALGGFSDEGGEFLESDDLVVTWAVGHLLELAEPQDYDPKLKAWTVGSLPIIPDEFRLKPKEGLKKRVDLIKKLAAREDISGLVNACDAGREGEIIFRRITEYLGLSDMPLERLWLQSMTKPAIRDAFQHLRPGKDLERLADAAWLRGVGDWLIGMNATRALTKRLKGRNESGAWSAGRVQTPTLGLLVEREREILAHIPRDFWEIEGHFEAAGQSWAARYWDGDAKDDDDRDQRPGRIFDRARVEAVVAAVNASKKGVASERRKKSKQSPPLPFDLGALQREANRRFSFSAKRTLNAAQHLYEGHKLITYPRTDSRHLPQDYGATVEEVVGNLARITEFQGVVAKITADGLQNLERILDDTKISDHFAIIPTGRIPEEQMGPDDVRVYELIVRQFLAALMGPATWATVERLVHVDVGPGDVVPFRASAKSLEIPGFLEALGQEAGAGTTLPALTPGQDQSDGLPAAVLDITDVAKQTQPPGRYSEASLLRAMETAGERFDEDELSEAMKGRGIGTPATRAEIIERLVSTGYSRRMEGKIGPTPKGMRLIDILERVKAPTLASARLTGEWEHALIQVERGDLTRAVMLDRLTDYTRDVTSHLVGFEHDEIYMGEPDLGACPACADGRVRESAWGYPCSNNKVEGATCNFMIWKDRAGRYIDRSLVRRILAEGKVGPVEGFVDFAGRPSSAVVSLQKDPDSGRWILHTEWGAAGGIGAEEIGAALFKCPMHEDCQIIETNHRFVCQQVLEGKTRQGPVLPKIVCQREMTVEEAEVFFGPEARTPMIDNFISKRSRPFKGMLVRKETGRHGFEFPEREGAGEDKGGRRGKAAERAAAKAAEKAAEKAAKAEAAKAARALARAEAKAAKAAEDAANGIPPKPVKAPKAPKAPTDGAAPKAPAKAKAKAGDATTAAPAKAAAKGGAKAAAAAKAPPPKPPGGLAARPKPPPPPPPAPEARKVVRRRPGESDTAVKPG